MARGSITAVDWIGRLRVTDYALLSPERGSPGRVRGNQCLPSLADGEQRDCSWLPELRLTPGAVNCTLQHCFGAIFILFEEYITKKVKYNVILFRLRLLSKVDKFGDRHLY